MNAHQTQPIPAPRLAWLSVLAGALMLCTPAFLNNFPFLYADTGTYLGCGFHGTVSDYRPLTYGLFLRHVSLHESLWLVVLVQAFMVSWTIHAFYRSCSARPVGLRPLTAIVVLTLATNLGVLTGMLMPDFLTPVLILCAAILLYAERLPKSRLVFAAVLLWLGVAAHHSNAYIFGIVLLGVATFNLVQHRRNKHQHGPPLRRLLLVAAVFVVGYFTIPTLHWAYSGQFFWSKAKAVFLTNRVNQMGLLQSFLRENCAKHTYNLCPYQDQLPQDLLWDPNSPLAKTGGWGVNEPEYARLLDDFFASPRYAKKFVVKSLENGVMQFFTFEGRVVFKEREDGYPFAVMQDVLPEFLPSIRRSLQYNEQWSSAVTDVLQRFLVYGSFLLLLWGFVFQRPEGVTPLQTRLAGFLALALVVNAFICAGVSMVDMRFQYRVVWLAPFFALWWVGEMGWLRMPAFRNDIAVNA